MFLKPYKIKSNTPLKVSEVKRLRQRLEKDLNATQNQLDLLLPPKSSIVSLIKLLTHSGFQTNVYCVDKLPMFFEIEGEMNTITLAPTIYAMWNVPELLPYFTTFPGVLPKLSNGADLMLPGVVPQGTGMNIYGRYKQSQLVAVNLTSNKAAVGIGMLIRSSDDLYMCGGRGSAVKMLQLFGDKLWAHEPALAKQMPHQKSSNLLNEDFPELGADNRKKEKQTVAAKSLAEIVGNTKPNHTRQEVGTANVDDFMSNAAESNRSEAHAVDSISNIVESNTSEEHVFDTTDTELSSSMAELVIPSDSVAETATVEEILKKAFLAALKNHGKTLQLPLLTSNFYRLYVVPEASQPIDLKKTKYKKLSNFLNEMSEQGFLVVREESKGVDKITSIDLEHEELVNFITDVKPQPVDGETQEQPLFRSELTELYIVTDDTAPFFTKLNYKRGEGIPATQIKKIIREYISKHGLPVTDATAKSIKLDETLQRICDCTAATLSQICNAVINKMDHSYQMCMVKDISANKPLIQMSIATRSGNKKVTLISNVECYGIIIPEFIKLCKQGAAASTTIVKLPNNREQLQIQGNQIRFLYNLLTETYKVPGKCILGLQLAKDGKKNKKK